MHKFILGIKEEKECKTDKAPPATLRAMQNFNLTAKNISFHHFKITLSMRRLPCQPLHTVMKVEMTMMKVEILISTRGVSGGRFNDIDGGCGMVHLVCNVLKMHF